MVKKIANAGNPAGGWRLWRAVRSLTRSMSVGGAVIALACACGSADRHETHLEKRFAIEQTPDTDSVSLPYLIHPFRWYIRDDKMQIEDLNGEYFGHIFSLPEMKPVCRFGRQGHGPGEYINPGLACMQCGTDAALFEAIPNRLDIYRLGPTDSMELVETRQFPEWMKERAIPKAYSRLWQVKDSLYIGIAFPPRFPEIDLLNMSVPEVEATLNFPLQGSEEAGSYPYLFSASYSNGKLALAYRYIDRIEVYDVLPEGFRLDYVIGDGQPQEELSIRGRDDEMICHYTAVECDGERILALYQGCTDARMSGDGIKSAVEIYRASTGEGEVLWNMGRRIDDMAWDAGHETLYGYSALSDSALFYVFRSRNPQETK